MAPAHVRTMLVLVPSLLVLTIGALAAQAPVPTPTTGTARLSGRVVTTTDAQPVRRAIVQVSGAELSRSRATITDDQGRFAFEALPAGRLTVTASRPGFIASSYGSTAPGRPGTPITVAGGQQLADVRITLARGAVIAGRVTNVDGEPMPGVTVAVVRASLGRAAASLPSPTAGVANTMATDDRGMYRIYGMEAGEYLVAAGVHATNAEVGMLTSAEIDVGIRDLQQRKAGRSGAGAPPPPPVRSYGFAPVFFSGALEVAHATSVTVAAGEERSGVDIVFRLSPAVAIDGVVTAPDGTPPPVLLSLAPAIASPLPSNLSPRPSLSAAAGSDGRFRYIGVTPGTYVLSARTQPASREAALPATTPAGTTATPVVLWASTTVTVTSGDASGIALSLRPALNIGGRVVFDRVSFAPPADFGAVRVTLPAIGVAGGYSVGGGALNGRIPVEAVSVAKDGSFQLSGVVAGTYQIAATVAGTNWWLRSAMLDGRDLLDVPLEMTADSADITSVVLTFSDRHTELAGMLQTTTGTPAAEYFIVVFTTDRSFWRNGQRRLRSVRPATDGAYSLRDLPPGEYFVAALTDLDPAWQTAAVLDQLVPGAITVRIGEGESVRQDLRLTR